MSPPPIMSITPNRNRSGVERTNSNDPKDPKALIKASASTSTSASSDLGLIKRELVGLNQKYLEVAAKLDTLLAMMDRITTLEGQVGVLQGQITAIQEENVQKSEIILSLQQRMNKSEQYSRKESIEIREVPIMPNENVEELVVSVARKLDINLTVTDISATHRLKAARDKVPAIIVRFVSRRKKEEFLAKRRTVITRDQLVANAGTGRIYIGESLSPFYKKLLWQAREKAKGIGYKYTWWRAGVCVRKGDDTAVVKINCEEDLELII